MESHGSWLYGVSLLVFTSRVRSFAPPGFALSGRMGRGGAHFTPLASIERLPAVASSGVARFEPAGVTALRYGVAGLEVSLFDDFESPDFLLESDDDSLAAALPFPLAVSPLDFLPLPLSLRA